MDARRIFLLSPASSSGQRARILMSERAEFELAVRLRSSGASLGEVFSFLSGLYFRGKLEYARAFARPPEGSPGVLVITPHRGLLDPEVTLDLPQLRAFAEVPVDTAEPRYRDTLLHATRALADRVAGAEIVLLGSIATGKYTDVLCEVLGERLLFPREFVGRGDMSRGGLLLRCVDAAAELEYVPVLGATRHGQRPPKLSPRK